MLGTALYSIKLHKLRRRGGGGARNSRRPAKLEVSAFSDFSSEFTPHAGSDALREPVPHCAFQSQPSTAGQTILQPPAMSP